MTPLFLRLSGNARLAVIVVGFLILLGCRHVSEHKTAVSGDAAMWRSDFRAFTEALRAVADGGKVPPLERLVQRARADWKSVTCITDGEGGLIELPPREGTTGWMVNRSFAGERVTWTITLVWEPDSVRAIGRTKGLGPKEAQPHKLRTSRSKEAEVVEIRVPKDSLPDGLKAGDVVMVEGRIGDAIQSTFLEPSGVNAAYHYYVEGKNPRTVFVVALEDATVHKVKGQGGFGD